MTGKRKRSENDIQTKSRKRGYPFSRRVPMSKRTRLNEPEKSKLKRLGAVYFAKKTRFAYEQDGKRFVRMKINGKMERVSIGSKAACL